MTKFFSYLMATIKITEGKTFHPKHRLTDLHDFFADRVTSADHVLDVGCNLGHIAGRVARCARQVTAIDIRPEVVERARVFFPASNIDYLVTDFFQFSPSQQYHVILLSNVLEHISDRVTFLDKCRSIAPRLLVRVPAVDRDWLVPYRRELGLEWRLHTDHEIEYTEVTLRQELEAAGYSGLECFERFGAVHCSAQAMGGDPLQIRKNPKSQMEAGSETRS